MKSLFGILGILLVAALVNCGPSRDQIRVQGCRDSIIAAMTKQYGAPPPEVLPQLSEQATNACKELLGVK